MNNTNTNSNYRGRFAPTPSGPLHFGSIIAALGSYLQAKSKKGKWLVRIDDVDLARTVAGADKIILQQLAQLGLIWDEDVLYQSQRLELYQNIIKKLKRQNCAYSCSCSRKQIGNQAYPGTCRNGVTVKNADYSIRIKTNDNEICVYDLLQGNYTQQLESQIGDFVIKRADGYFAYHLATVFDDAEQNITEVVRGIDLLESTPRQIYLQNKLNLKTPAYIHLPIAIDETGKKISKSNESQLNNLNNPNKVLFDAICFLGQQPPEQLVNNTVEFIINWAINNWDLERVPKEKEIMITADKTTL